jgi:phosphatidylserine/phosphatidylglycerophosphate/cardiolipin synthase-like enzyme
MLISALHYFGREGSTDEAVQVTNASPEPVSLDATWMLRDGSQRTWRFPDLILPPGAHIWVASNALSFALQFGYSPTLSYGGALSFANRGGSVSLQRSAPDVLDTANVAGGAWPAGTAGPVYRSMERIDAGSPDAPSNWASAEPAAPIAYDGAGNPVQGTPGAPNSTATPPTPSDTPGVIINEVAWSGTSAASSHEWLELYNNRDEPVSVTGWEVRIADTPFMLNGAIAAHGYFLIQRSATTFSSGAIADQTASFSLSNTGSALQLIDPNAEVVDTLAYGDAPAGPGWIGPPLLPYTVTQSIPDDGQILMRRLNPASALPVADTDTAQDWYNDRGDPLDARRPIYPGWRHERFVTPATGVGSLTLAVAPDSSYALVSQALSAATQSIDVASFTLEHAALGDLLAARAASGVAVRLLLDGAPVGGLKDQTRWICSRITAADPSGRSGCWFMRSDSADKIHARYAFLHSKFAIIDGARLLMGSENFGPRGMPSDDTSDGTAGQRGVIALIDAPTLIVRASAIFAADIDSANRDITRWCASCPVYGPPAATFVPDYASGGISYTVRHAPLAVSGSTSMTLFSSPENHLGASLGVIALLRAAGAGDEILAEQLDEPPFWGPAASNASVDPNPRLQAILDAAARGARVRLLFDGHYDDPSNPRSNRATVLHVMQLVQANGWDVRAALGNPTGLGIHNKMVLVRLGERRFAHVGSWNGTEVSAKRNREMSVLIESNEAHAYLRDMFVRDFQVSQPAALPILFHDYRPIDHPLISEILYNPKGANEDGREWVELFNPTPRAVALAEYKVGDAVNRGATGEGMFAFPAGALLAPNDAIVIAQNAAAFFADWGVMPDYELSNYDARVPDMIPHAIWAGGNMNLANSGDEVVLLDNSDTISDVVAWLGGSAPGVVACPAMIAPGHSLQRWPPARDTDDCVADFRDQAIPSPGAIP